MGVWHSPYWAERGERRHHDMAHIKPSGTGSISTIFKEDEEIAEVLAKRIPIGFAPPAPTDNAEPWGEADWTARDIR